MVDELLKLIKGLGKILWVSIVAIILLIGGCASLTWWLNKDNHAEIAVDKRINITPQQIQSIQRIGQWEFLSISDEEIVDTVSRGFFRDSELARIYYGTLRLGIDLHQAKPKWLQAEDSVVTATLPPIELLDRNFIDEARTRPFFESGSWSDSDKEALYQQAYKKMIARCLTPENIRVAEENARNQFTQLLHGMGFKHVIIEFEKEKGLDS